MDKLLEILQKIKPGVDFKEEVNLVEDSILDSFDMFVLVGELNEVYEIEIGIEDFLPENFNTVTNIMSLITRLQNEE